VTELESPALTILFQSSGLPPDRRDPQKLARAIGALRPPLAVLEQALATGLPQGNRYLLGERFTVADLNVASVLGWTRAAPQLLEEFPLAREWLERCLQRDAYRAVKAMGRLPA
jgi:glutathione S-transferase